MNPIPTLLVVDDEPDLRLLVKLLVGDDYEIIETGDGDEALELLTTRDDIDVVLLDIRIPGIDGFGILDHLQRQQRLDRLHVIAFSAHAERAVVERAVRQGVHGFLSKPFTPEELTATLAASRAGAPIENAVEPWADER